MAFTNTYGDVRYADAYATLEFPNTYALAFRDLPAIVAAHAAGGAALDFGCGAGRSTRFLRRLGFAATGVDVSAAMIAKAREIDPGGDYRLVADGDIGAFAHRFDLVLSAFTFDNVPTADRKVALLRRLGDVLTARGRFVNLVSSPDIYTHEWASFSTRDFPENLTATDGDIVRTIITDLGDRRPVEDVLCSDAAYREAYARAGLEVLDTCRPLGRPDEPWPWVSETTVAPWVIYVLERAKGRTVPVSSTPAPRPAGRP